eukprot:GFUD01133698.1.p1 GENE.GFUD01133698.1~~GFUD01133698.1.p1  ORF type:complete len:219 (-),score=45.18 GFUD01133698.1:177-833(-)
MEMETLKQICMSVVIELGMSRAQLPLTLKNEVEIMEERIMSEWTGIFSNSETRPVKIDWSGGEWTFSPQIRRGYRYRRHSGWSKLRPLPPSKIKGGSTNDLGYPGGRLFLLFGRKVWIDDYKISVKERKAIFNGSYSSPMLGTRRQFSATLTLSSDQDDDDSGDDQDEDVDHMRMVVVTQSEVDGEDAKVKVQDFVRVDRGDTSFYSPVGSEYHDKYL